MVSPWEFGPALTSYRIHRRTSNFPTDGTNCKVTVFRPSHYNEFVESGSKSWALIRRRLVLWVKNTQNRAAQRPRKKGPLTRGRVSPTPLGHTGASFLSLGLSLLLGCPPDRGDLCCYIFLSSVHPSPTLVSHPCLSSSACPIGHSFWCSVSCCGPHRPV